MQEVAKNIRQSSCLTLTDCRIKADTPIDKRTSITMDIDELAKHLDGCIILDNEEAEKRRLAREADLAMKPIREQRWRDAHPEIKGEMPENFRKTTFVPIQKVDKKKCSICGRWKCLEDYPKSRKSKDGRMYTCTECRNKKTK